MSDNAPKAVFPVERELAETLRAWSCCFRLCYENCGQAVISCTRSERTQPVIGLPSITNVTRYQTCPSSPLACSMTSICCPCCTLVITFPLKADGRERIVTKTVGFTSITWHKISGVGVMLGVYVSDGVGVILGVGVMLDVGVIVGVLEGVRVSVGVGVSDGVK